jgi:dipeptidyl-peptidase-4
VLAALVAGAPPATPEPAFETLTPERLHADPPLDGPVPTEITWHPDGKRVTYLRRDRADGPQTLWGFDASTGKAAALVDGSGLVAPLGGGPVSLERYAWAPKGDAVLVASHGDVFLVDTPSGRLRALAQGAELEEFPTFSPDGRRVAFVRSGDLFAVEVASGRETRLTRSGSAVVLNGRLDWVYEEELAGRSGRAFAWAPDSRSIAYLQLDQDRVPTFPIVDFLPVHNKAVFQRYPKAGDPNSIVRVGVVGLGSDGAPGPERLVSFEQDDVYVDPELAWTADGRNLAFRWLNRAQTELQLRMFPVPSSPDAALGEWRTVLTERDTAWVNALGEPRFLKDGRRFLWLSERDGFAHVYVCDLAGSCRPVTQGRWMVDRLLSVDERTGFCYFTTTEKDPRERHLYRARLDGTGHARLTQEDGLHDVRVSPDGRYFADTWSDVATPPRVWVQTTDGRRRISVEDNASAPALRYERGVVEWVDLKAADGTVLHGRLVKPSDFDPSRRHPVVVHVYGGPHAQTVRDGWSSLSMLERLLASRGFLVWSLDNRGTWGRGHGFETPLHREMGRVELQDQLVGVEHLKSLPFVDPGRIGVWGWSYGGYMTLYALTRAPDVFKAGVAGAPVVDWTLYDTIYTERYMGTPQQNPGGYEISSPLARAADLEAELLLIHGTGDDNVHLANTVKFADALIRAGRPHAVLLHPRQSHGFRDRDHKVARDAAIVRHFERHLSPEHAPEQTATQ